MLRSAIRQTSERQAIKSCLGLLRNVIEDQQGSVPPIMVSFFIFGSVGGALAVDLARAYSAREQLLLVAESAALAAATALPDIDTARKVAMQC